MTRKQLIAQVQDLGRLREQLGEIKKAEGQLADCVRAGLAKAKLSRVDSADYSACLDERQTLVVNAAKLRRKLDDKAFMACIRVDLAAARRQLAAADLEKLGTYEPHAQLRVLRLPAREEG